MAARVPAGGSVLEVAAGPGYLAIELAKLGRHRVSGMDISKSFVRIATENAQAAGASIELREGNAAELPYEDESFDFVVCRAAFIPSAMRIRFGSVSRLRVRASCAQIAT